MSQDRRRYEHREPRRIRTEHRQTVKSSYEDFRAIKDYRERRREDKDERRHRYKWSYKRSNSWEHRSEMNIQPVKSDANYRLDEVSNKDTDRSHSQVCANESKVECEQSVKECNSVEVPSRISVKYSHFKRKFDSSDDESSDDD